VCVCMYICIYLCLVSTGIRTPDRSVCSLVTRSTTLSGLLVDSRAVLKYDLKSSAWGRDGPAGKRGCAVGWGTTLQAGRSRVRFPIVSLEFFIDIILPAALWPWGRLRL
jgi:hypothetical protein